MARSEDQIERLYDAIDLVKSGERAAACELLRDLIREDNEFEDAWMWMSIAVENPEQSSLCLENVLRINPDNVQAAAALYRLRQLDTQIETTRNRLRSYRDAAFVAMWLVIFSALCGVIATYVRIYDAAVDAIRVTLTP